jgi:hypothetical protein
MCKLHDIVLICSQQYFKNLFFLLFLAIQTPASCAFTRDIAVGGVYSKSVCLSASSAPKLKGYQDLLNSCLSQGMQPFRDDTEEAMTAVEDLMKVVNVIGTVYVQKTYKCRTVGYLPIYGFSCSTVDECGADTTLFCEYIKGE